MSASELPVKGETTISCYLHDIPEFVEKELATTYETLHSSLPFFKVWRSLDNVSCYIARRDKRASEVLLFSCERRQVVVLNEMIAIEPAGLQRFANYIFEHFPAIDVIRFNAVNTSSTAIGFPVQRHNAKDTFMISLPATPDEYLAALGKSTRASVRSRLNNIRRNFPSFTVKTLVNEGIDEDTVRRIVRFSEQRISARGVEFRHDIDRIFALAKTCGFVTMLSIDGRLCAGSINYRIGASVFGEITAHDPAYDRHGLGILCVYHTACEIMKSGGRKLYLGGGLFTFKERMLGKQLDMDQLQIYRSYGKFLRNLDLAAVAFAQGQVRRVKRKLHESKGTWGVDLVFRLFHAYKNKTEN